MFNKLRIIACLFFVTQWVFIQAYNPFDKSLASKLTKEELLECQAKSLVNNWKRSASYINYDEEIDYSKYTEFYSEKLNLDPVWQVLGLFGIPTLPISTIDLGGCNKHTPIDAGRNFTGCGVASKTRVISTRSGARWRHAVYYYRTKEIINEIKTVRRSVHEVLCAKIINGGPGYNHVRILLWGKVSESLDTMVEVSTCTPDVLEERRKEVFEQEKFADMFKLLATHIANKIVYTK